MKVLIIPSWYPSDSYPNNGIFFKEQAEALKKQGMDVTVLCIEIPYRKTKKDYKYFKTNKYIQDGIEVYRYVFPLSFLHRLPRLFYIFLDFVTKIIYRTQIAYKKVDIIHAQSFLTGGAIALSIKKKYGCRCVITEHTSKILRHDLNKVEEKKLVECVRISDKFICVSKNLKKEVEKITGISGVVRVQPNMVNEIFSYIEKERNPFIFCSVGNLIPIKRMNLLIESFCQAFSINEDVKMKIVGQGSEYENLLQLIKMKKREKQIILMGALNRKEVAKILNKSNVMALLSEFETFGIAYIEALASGNVIIGCNNGGANDIIDDNNGILVKNPEINDVALAMRKVFEDYQNYDLFDISKRCLEKYSGKTFGKTYETIFYNVLYDNI